MKSLKAEIDLTQILKQLIERLEPIAVTTEPKCYLEDASINYCWDCGMEEIG
ncbi:MAG: hypothetical protein N4J56_007395 [Chroococcidiopsis sp. SAG 2025]|uniref:hypothetical protein n=1 Tax=Chroococcidiopsis sp. SAG 2025 TaxID=171389 RepID=UPI0029372E5C|nr:hypothetical protein [Chroococcidiopsis sp. SAG 2025]MDV2997690.1 hypothetical protein [Chroococcidiopsis sp. SAG 2025]